MQVNRIDSQSFQAIDISKVGNKLMNRFGTHKRYMDFCILNSTQDCNPYKIMLDLGKHNNILGEIIDFDGNVLYKKNENILSGLLNLSPVRFLKNLCKEADKFNGVVK